MKLSLFTRLNKLNEKPKRAWRNFGTSWRVHFFDDRLYFKIRRSYPAEVEGKICGVVHKDTPDFLEFWPRFTEAGYGAQMDWHFLELIMPRTDWYIRPSTKPSVQGVRYLSGRRWDGNRMSYKVDIEAGIGMTTIDTAKKMLVSAPNPKFKGWKQAVRKETNQYIKRLQEHMIVRANLGAFGHPWEKKSGYSTMPGDAQLSALLADGDIPQFKNLEPLVAWCAGRNYRIRQMAWAGRQFDSLKNDKELQWPALIKDGICAIRDRIHKLAGSYSFDDTPTRLDLDGGSTGAENLELFPLDDF